MDSSHPSSVKTSVTIKEIEDAFSSIQEWTQEPLSVELVDKLAAGMRKLESEVRRLSTRLRFHGWVLRTIEKDLNEDDRLYVDCLEKVRFLLQLSDLIRDILADISLSSTPIISSISYRLQFLFYPLLNTSPCADNPDPTLGPLQRRLGELYEATLGCVSSLTLSLTNLTSRLSKFAVTLVPEIADSVAVGCFKSIACGHEYTPKASFRVAGECACRLMALFVKLTAEHEEREWMGWYVSKIFILLRVIESYFNLPQLKHRRGIFGQWNGSREVPTAGAGAFDIREIGGILAGILGAEIVLRVGATRLGVAVDVLVEKRVGALRRCLVLAWQREVKLIEKAKLLRSSRRVKFETPGEGGGEKKKNVVGSTDGSGTASEALDWEAQAAERAFQTSRAGKELSVVGWVLKTPANGALKREKVSVETGETPVARDDSGVTTPSYLAVRAERKVFQTPRKERKSAEDVETPTFVDGEAVKGEVTTETLQGEPAKMEADTRGGKEKKEKKKGYEGKHGEIGRV